MSGKTHMIIGATSSLFFLPTNRISTTIICASFGALGGMILDIDTRKSKGAVLFRTVKKAVELLLALVLIAILLGKEKAFFRILDSWNWWNVICLASLFLLYWYGSTTPHRSFTHSIEFVILNTFLLYFLPNLFLCAFLIGELSHIVLDLFNKKDVTLSVLLRIKVSLNLASADGIVDRMLSFLGMIGLIILFVKTLFS